MPSLRRAFAALLACAILVVVAPASAVSITLATNGISHTRTARTSNTPIGQISFADCINEDAINFSLTIADFASDTVEAWVGHGADCTQEINRTSSAQVCGFLKREGASDAVSNSNGAGTFTMTLPVRDIIQGTVNFTAMPPASADICDTDTSSGPATFTIFFMLLQSTGLGAALASTTWPNMTTISTSVPAFDLDGPAAPTGITVSGGDNRLIVKYSAPAGVTDLQGYRLYCNPPPGGPPAAAGAGGGGGTGGTGGDAGSGGASSGAGGATGGDAGNGGATAGAGGSAGSGGLAAGAGGTDAGSGGLTAGAGGSDAGSAGLTAGAGSAGTAGGGGAGGVGACDSAPLVPGQRPDERYFCGTSDQAKGLLDGQLYAVAVASTDKYGNVGVLSDAVCGTPAPVTGFFEAYRAAGGRAGGGFCNMGATPAPSGAFWLLGATGLLVWRRRRTR